MNKQLLTTTLLSMLVVSCAGAPSSNPIGSVSSSNNSTPTTSPSSLSSSSSISSPQGSTTVVSSSSTSSSSSSSSSTSQTPVNTKKVPFNQIGSLVAQVVDAKALGVSNSKDNVSTPRGRHQAQEDEVDSSEQNKMVKVTETYNPTTKVAEDKTLEVVFTRTTTTQTTELQTGMDTYVATADDITIERLTDEPGRVVIKNISNHEFRALNGDIVLEDWTSGEEDTITFTFEETITDITIESRSTDASISFTAFEGFTYEVKSGEISIKANLKDNQEDDLNVKEGVITIKGLTQGLPYDVHYSGNVVLETITQEEVDGQVDKLYVLYQYTFISFVPLTLNSRPEASLLENDYDDVALYDKTDYYSDSTRQSFVVDNDTGLIYKIENTQISNLSGGCISIQDNPYPFDMRINLQGELEFYSLYQNPSIVKNYCIKDKNGNKYIGNNQINQYDENTKTLYFVKSVGNNSIPGYWLTSSGEVVKSTPGFDINSPIFHQIIDLSMGLDRPLNANDNYDVYWTEKNIIPSSSSSVGIDYIKYKFVVQKGRAIFFNYEDYFSKSTSNNFGYFYPSFYFSEYKDDVYSSYQLNYSSCYLLKDLLKISNACEPLSYINKNVNSHYIDQEILLLFINGNVYEIRNILKQSAALFNETFYDTKSIGNQTFNLYRNPNFGGLVLRTLLEGVTIENGTITKIGLSGNIQYEFYPEFQDGEMIIKTYVSGTYVAPPAATITFQPINK